MLKNTIGTQSSIKVKVPTRESQLSSVSKSGINSRNQTSAHTKTTHGHKQLTEGTPARAADKSINKTTSVPNLNQSVKRRAVEALTADLNASPAIPCGGKKNGLTKSSSQAMCDECRYFIYDFSDTDAQGAMRAVYVREGVQSSTYLVRADGLFMTQNCPAALRKKKAIFNGVVMAVSIYLILLMLFWGSNTPPPVH